MMLIAAGAAALRGAGRRRNGGAFMFLVPHSAGRRGPQAAAEGRRGDKKDGKADPNAPQVQDGPDGVVFYTPPDIVVNMQTPDGKPTFLKLKLTFELPDHDTADTHRRGHAAPAGHVPDLPARAAARGPVRQRGQLQLRMELQRRVNLVIAPAKVNGVLIEEMLIN